MLGQYWYHGLVRKYVAVFGTIFNDISIQRRNSSGNVTETIKVPLAYGPKQKFLTRISGDANLDKKVGMQLPRMGFDMTSMSYSPERMLHPLHNRAARFEGETGIVKSPVPYDFAFALNVYVKNADDGTQIVEQILPFFQPDFTVTINALPTMGIKIDLPIVLGGVNVEDSYEGDFLSRRALIWSLDFTLKGYLYPNIKGKGFGDGSDNEATKLIRTSIINFHVIPHAAVALPDPEYIVLESDNVFGAQRSHVINEDGSKFLSEATRGDRNRALVKSRIMQTVGNVDPTSADYDITETRDFFAEGIEFDPVTGLDERAPSLDVQALGNKNL
jgi:hypothetical protein|tara:strand:+ start:872 stop:1864 length:993 start_codon:yes stop_codon:yes gene_type:complete